MLLPLLLALAGALPVQTLDSLLDATSRPRGGTAAAVVVRLSDDSVLWDHDGFRRMLPASTQKVLTGAALRSRLGPSSTLPTRILARGAVTDSVLHGDLVLEGNGDPSFARGADSSRLLAMARTLHRSGLRRVEGGLVVRDALMRPADRPWPGSWDWDNSLTDCDGGASIGVSVDGNCPGDSSLAFPHRWAAARLRAALARAGISVDGPERFELGAFTSPMESLLVQHDSPILDSLLREALWKSSNHDMETFGMVLGASDTVSSRKAGLLRVRGMLSDIGLDTARNDIQDISGLSRKNATTSLAMAHALARIARTPAMNVFPLLPSPGVGTLATRMRRTFPKGAKLHAKTGSLDGVSSIVGLLEPPSGDSLVFVLFFQGHVGPATSIRFAQDQIIGVLAGGPVIAPTARDTTPPAPKPPKPPRSRPIFLEP